MTNTKIFIVAPKACADRFSEGVINDVIPEYRDFVIVLNDEVFDINNVTNAAKKISDVIEDAGANDESYLFIVKNTRAHHGKLLNRWDASGKDSVRAYVGEDRRICEMLKKTLMLLGFHWRAHARVQLDRFEGQTTDIDRWCQQFFKLGVGHLGRRLAMQLQVIRFEGHKHPFRPRRHETFGQKVMHCYCDDGDDGGSWISIQDQLSHDFPAEMVQAIQVTADKICLPTCEADELVIYEDGLWSGSETVKRLGLIKASESSLPIRLKFSTVSDFGLMVARQAIRKLDLENMVRIDANEAKLVRFLKKDIPLALQYGQGMEPKAYFKALHGYVEQSAFHTPDNWPEGIDAARDVAKDIGSQLVRDWYKNERPGDDVVDGIAKFCMGGGGFASTVMFTRSVPKVCLPLFWLSGPVTLNGVSVEWKPLFLDARRVDHELLLAD